MLVRSLGVLFFLLLVWQWVILIFNLPSYVLPSPSQVAISFYQYRSVLLVNLMPTLYETLMGLLLGILFGMGLAMLMTAAAMIRYWLLPLTIISQAIPTFVFAPILVNWFGYGMLSKVLTITLMLFFPVASAFYNGLSRTPQHWLDTALIMSNKRWSMLWRVKFPAALPSLAIGIRLATVLAPMGAIISEWVGAGEGLGFLMLNANARLESGLLFASVFILMAMSLSLYGLCNILLKHLINW
jgi:putative hydroxymethylpyrimidine transport system permease protein